MIDDHEVWKRLSRKVASCGLLRSLICLEAAGTKERSFPGPPSILERQFEFSQSGSQMRGYVHDRLPFHSGRLRCFHTSNFRQRLGVFQTHRFVVVRKTGKSSPSQPPSSFLSPSTLSVCHWMRQLAATRHRVNDTDHAPTRVEREAESCRLGQWSRKSYGWLIWVHRPPFSPALSAK